MKRKTLLIFLTLLAILFINTVSFATNNIENGIENTANTIMNGAGRLGNDVKNGIEGTANTIEDGARNLGNTLSSGMQTIGNALTEDNMNNDNTGANYTATRTTASDTIDTDIMNSNLWTWVAVGVAGIVIVGLVWYYAKEHNNIEH